MVLIVRPPTSWFYSSLLHYFVIIFLIILSLLLFSLGVITHTNMNPPHQCHSQIHKTINPSHHEPPGKQTATATATATRVALQFDSETHNKSYVQMRRTYLVGSTLTTRYSTDNNSKFWPEPRRQLAEAVHSTDRMDGFSACGRRNKLSESNLTDRNLQKDRAIDLL